jgi:hypothetical protein
MSLYSRDPILLTPGPITTSLATKTAMLRDWGSWDANFNAVTAEVRRKLLDIVNGHDGHVCVPLQGSGTFSVEAAINTLVPRAGHVLVLINGAYGARLARLAQMMGRKVSTFETAEDVPTTPEDVDRLLGADPSITHVGLIHCETSTGILNPLPEIAAVVQRHGRSLVVDAMSSFAAIAIDARATPFDALIAASATHRGRRAWASARAPQRARAMRRQLVVARSTCTTSGRTWRRRRNGAIRRRRTSSSRSTPRSTSTSPRAASRRGSRATRGIARRSWPE